KLGRERLGMWLDRGIAVNGDDVGPRLEQRARIAARSEGPVDNATALDRRQGCQHFLEENRGMRPLYQLSLWQGWFTHVRHNSTPAQAGYINSSGVCTWTLKILFPISDLPSFH